MFSKGSRLNGDLVDINKPVEVLESGDFINNHYKINYVHVVFRERNTTPFLMSSNTMASKVVSKQGVTIP